MTPYEKQMMLLRNRCRRIFCIMFEKPTEKIITEHPVLCVVISVLYVTFLVTAMVLSCFIID